MSFGIESFAKALEAVSHAGEQQVASMQDALQRIESYGDFLKSKVEEHSLDKALKKLGVDDARYELRGKVNALYEESSEQAFKEIDKMFYNGPFVEHMAVYDVISDKLFGLENAKLKNILSDMSRPVAERDMANFYLDTRNGMAEFRAESLSSLIPRMAQEYCDPFDPASDLIDAQDAAEDRIQRVAEKIEDIESWEPPVKRGKISETLEGETITYYTDDDGKVAGFRVGNISEKTVHEYRIPNAEYTLDGFTYHTDDQGRVTLIEGYPRFPEEDSVRNQVDQRTSGGLDRADSDDGGHLVAKLLGGDSSWLNIVPMDATLNRGAYKSLELTVAKMLENGENPKIKIEVRYDDQQGIRPSGFTYTVETKDKTIPAVFNNVCGR